MKRINSQMVFGNCARSGPLLFYGGGALRDRIRYLVGCFTLSRCAARRSASSFVCLPRRRGAGTGSVEIRRPGSDVLLGSGVGPTGNLSSLGVVSSGVGDRTGGSVSGNLWEADARLILEACSLTMSPPPRSI